MVSDCPWDWMLCQALHWIWGNTDWAGPSSCFWGTHGPAAGMLQIQAIQIYTFEVFLLVALFLGVSVHLGKQLASGSLPPGVQTTEPGQLPGIHRNPFMFGLICIKADVLSWAGQWQFCHGCWTISHLNFMACHCFHPEVPVPQLSLEFVRTAGFMCSRGSEMGIPTGAGR